MKRIEKKNIESIWALTPLQEGMLFHYLEDSHSESYFEQLSLNISGEVDGDRFQKAWNAVVTANSVLRTVFRWEKLEKPTQIILKEFICPITFIDFSHEAATRKEFLLAEIKEKDKQQGFDLQEVPFRIMLCKMADQEYEMIISNHHILYDGWSNGIILKEFFNYYHELSQGRAPLLATKQSFKEFLKWLQDQEQHHQREVFWREQLLGLENKTELPIKKPKAKKTAASESFAITLENTIKDKLYDFVKQHRVTLAGVFYTAWGIILQKYCASDDVLLGTTVSGRSVKIKGIEDIVGLFINTIPLRVQGIAHETIGATIARIDKVLKAREEYENTPLLDIMRYSGVGGQESLFDTIMAIENYPLDSRLLPADSLLTIRSYSMFEMTHYDLTVSITLFDQVEIRFAYKPECFYRETIESMAGHFYGLLQQIIESDSFEVCTLQLMSEAEKKRILYAFNSTSQSYPTDKTIHQLFAEEVERRPETLAVVGTNNQMGRLSYAQLNEQANRLALVLQEKGVQPNTIIGIMVERSLEMVIGIMGILKSGGAYLPIDPNYPGERLHYMMSDASANILVTTSHLASRMTVMPGVICLDHGDFLFASSSGKLPVSQVKPSHLAYIIYTSGSTGKPKGVLVEHGSAVNLLYSMQRRYPLTEQDTYLLKTSYVFDVSVSELFGWYMGGGRLVVGEKNGEKDPQVMMDWIEAFQITHINFVPSMFNAFVVNLDSNNIKRLASLKYIFLAGEALLAEHVKKFRSLATTIRLENIYGPTESTVYASWYSLSDWQEDSSIPIGKPLDNIRLYIIDSHLHLVPPEIVGELCIAGIGLARGYLNRPELTADKFQPAVSVSADIKETLYKTGDLARWRHDGNIEFLGRIDQQVKIRGFRVELGEIENQLLKHELITEAVVVVKTDEQGDKNLVAYFVAESELSSSGLRDFLLTELPEYMVPLYFMRLAAIPLTATGKIDRRALPDPELKESAPYCAPRNEMENQLVEIWGKILGKLTEPNKIGIDDHFFRLGGHSLKATSLASSIYKVFNVKIPLSEIFKRPTIRSMSEYIKNALAQEFTAIPLVGEREYYSLSSAQKRLHFLQQLEPDGTTYNIYNGWYLDGELDIHRLETVFVKLIKRHESLRTSFHMIGEEPVQKIHAEVTFAIEYVESYAYDLIKGFVRPFDLTRAPLMRVGVYKVSGQSHILVVDMHHIISDGMSIELLSREFSHLLSGQELPPLRLQYKDYAAWQIQEKESKNLKEQEQYWLKIYTDEISVLDLPIDYPRPSVQHFAGNTIEFEMDQLPRLNKLALESGATLYMVLLTLYTIFLAKISNQEDIIVGTPVAGRSHAEAENIIGMFVNTLALRNYPLHEKSFIQFLQEVKTRTLDAFENQDYQYEDLVEKVVQTRDASRNPLFDTMFALQNTGARVVEMPGLRLSHYPLESDTAKFDFTLNMVESAEKLAVSFQYCTKLFKRETIERLISYLNNIIDGVLEDTQQTLGHIEILSQSQRHALLVEVNDLGTIYPIDKTIHGLFLAQVERTPQHLALTGTSPQRGEVSLSYRELEEISREVAHYLSKQGIGPDHRVAILVDRSVEMIFAILGVLRCGAAYVPLDPKMPATRMNYVLADCGASMLLTFRKLSAEITRCPQILYLEELAYSQNGIQPLANAFENAQHLAYIIYTSGSTGKPKGVPISHQNFSPLIYWGYDHLAITPEDRVIQNLSYYFDWSVWEIFLALTSGARLAMITDEILLDPRAMVSFIQTQAISVLHITPTQYGYLVNLGEPMLSLRHLCIGAEKLTFDLVARSIPLISVDCRIYNMYGPTEVTIISAVADVHREQHYYRELSSVPIGQIVANTSLLVLDRALNPCPINVIGELYIAGDSVALGYLNDPEKTANSFVHNVIPEVKSLRLYKTGDRVKRLEDGSILFISRADFQVKIRGYRIELGEIENAVSQYPGVNDVLVMVKENSRMEKYLCGYIACALTFDMVAFREYLATKLPAYMIPSYFVKLAQMPLNPNGKVDRRALPEPEITTGEEYVAPRDEIENKLLLIWYDVLFGESTEFASQIGINNNFFYVGGHSLKTTILVSRIHKVFNVKVPLAEVFKKPTISGLAEYIKSAQGEQFSAITPIAEQPYYVLSSAQKRLHFLQQLEHEGTTYNIYNGWYLEGEFELDRFEAVLKTLIKRHESLRTSFHVIGEEAVQQIHAEVSFAIEYHQSYDHHVIKGFVRPFDLTQAPLMRVGLFKVSDKKHIMVVDMHHIISDGMSMEILGREFSILLSGQELPQLRLQYKDYAAWQIQEKAGKKLQEQEQYWVKMYADEISALDLPIDYARPPVQNFAGNTIEFVIDQLPHLNEIAFQTGTTLYMVLLSIYTLFLAKISNQEDIIVGTPVAGRSHAEIENIIGMFVNTLALRNFPAHEKSFLQYLQEIKTRTLEAFENQDYQYEDLVEKVVLTRDASRNPLFDTMFALQNTGAKVRDIPGLKLSHYPLESDTAKFDFIVTMVESTQKLDVSFQYGTKLFKKETIERLISYLNNIVVSVVEDITQSLGHISILSESQRQELVVQVNDLGTDYPTDKTIHGLFLDQVHRTPNHLALTGISSSHGNISLTYRELEEVTRELALYLSGLGIGPDHRAAILVNRSVEMILAILGVLRCGAAYVPLDPKMPATRLNYVLADCGASILLTFRKLSAEITRCPRFLYLEEFGYSSDVKQPLENSFENVENLAYIIYTSGSTGKPKGVPISHRNFSPVIHWGFDHLRITPADKAVQNLSYYFDWSVWEIFLALTSGARLDMITDEILLDPRAMVSFINTRAITILHITPTQYGYLVNVGEPMWSLRHLCIGAEKFGIDLVTRSIPLLAPDCRIYNMYGPTEATIICAVADVSHDKEAYRELSSVPIGQTLGNSSLVVLDRALNPCPINVIGELYIGGDSVGVGYLNDQEKSALSFVKNFLPEIKGDLLYKTGDRVKRLADGSLLFLSRADFQVKIRGYRIELGEIENAISQYPGVNDVLVMVRENQHKEKYLCGYIACALTFDITVLRDYLAAKLPAYMIPSYFVKLEKMPLNPNGKVDRKALPEPEIATGETYVAPRNEIEKKLLLIWNDVLLGESTASSSQIGINDNFFHVGGHSLKTTILVSRIHKVFNVKVPLAEVFKRPTIAGLAEYIKSAQGELFSAITPVAEKPYYVLSSAQKRVHFLQQLENEGTTYNIYTSWHLDGELDLHHLEAVLKKLINRHESLRTSFHVIGEEAVQQIHAEVSFAIEYHESFELDLIKGFVRPFDLTQAPLMRVGLFRVSEKKHIMVVDMHHIISDGMSMEILSREFSLLLSGQELPLLSLQYKDYAAWQVQEKEGQRLQAQEKYWVNVYADEISVLDLPIDYCRPSMQSFAGNTVEFAIEQNQVASLNEIVFQSGATLYMVLLSVYTIFLAKLSNQEDIVVGTPIAGRSHTEVENIIGMFVNTLALRNFPTPEKSFMQFLQEVKTRTLDAFENQDYQYEDLVEKVVLTRDASRNPLFDTMFALQNTGSKAVAIPGLSLSPYPLAIETAKFDLSLTVTELAEGLTLSFEYCTQLFTHETIQRFVTYFKNTVSAILADNNKRIADIQILPITEKNKILYEFNNTASDYGANKTIHQLFEEQVWRTPDHIVVVEDIHNTPRHVTYRELNRQAERLADTIKEKGVCPDTIIGLMVERSIEMVVGIMGILKAGAAYLPIATTDPRERVEFVLKDSGARYLVTTENLSELMLASSMPHILYIEQIIYSMSSLSLPAPHEVTPAHLAYIIYTSGTTGKPKGVMVEHRNVVAYIHAFWHEFKTSETDTSIQLTTFTFDLFIEEIFPVLLRGGKIVIPSKAEILDMDLLCQIIQKQRVSFVDCTPLLLNELNSRMVPGSPHNPLARVHTFISGGDVLKGDYINNLLKIGKIYNTYGPTETTVCATYYQYDNTHKDSLVVTAIPIGKPIMNYQLYILDKWNYPVPIGVGGELCIAGAGVTRGYLNRPVLTQEKFDHITIAGENRVIYRTGDLVRWTTQGNIVFMGRIDHQIKLRGFRIELGEIEARLLSHPEIKETLVMAKEDKTGDKYLCAYYVPRLAAPPAAHVLHPMLRDYLAETLPDYMVPPYFIRLEAIPLLSNGKIDRRALPEPEFTTGKEYQAPRNQIEENLVKIWAEVLNKEIAIGIHDNFFQLGGHSLKATSLAARISKTFQVKIPLTEIFTRPTIQGLSEYISHAVEEQYVRITPIEKKEYYALSSSQKRLYILQQLDKNGITYNISAAWTLEGILDKPLIEKALGDIILRHESLRTSFEVLDEEPIQRVHDRVEWAIEYFSDSPAGFIRPFELAKAPLLRCGLVKLAEDQHIMLVDMHHIISDGMSIEILTHEFTSLLAGVKLPALNIQYKDYAAWQLREKESKKLRQQETYWLQTFAGEIPVLDLPTDYSRPLVQTFEGSSQEFAIDENTTRVLNTIAMESGASLYMVLLSIYTIFLAKLSNQEDIVIGTPIAGRRYTEMESIIGMFVNSLALRNYPQAEKTYRDFLADIKTRTLSAFENQEYQYEDLVDKVIVTRDTSRNPLFDSMFVLQNMDTQIMEIPGLRLLPYTLENKTAKFDLSLFVSEVEEKLALIFEYNTQLFQHETIKRFQTCFLNTVLAIVENREQTLAEIEIIAHGEKERILYEFNNTRSAYPREKTIHQLFDEQVVRTPDCIAVIEDVKQLPQQITYQQLHVKANLLSHVLRESGVGPDSIIAIMVERSLEMVISVLAILKVGGAYMPIDVDYPPERKQYMLEDSGTAFLLTTQSLLSMIEGWTGKRFAVDEYIQDRGLLSFSVGHAASLAYIIYTSGSTGRPKGVMVSHRNVVRLVQQTNFVSFAVDDRILQTGALEFDASTFEIWGALLNGLPLCLAPKEKILNPGDLKQLILRHRITTMWLTSELFNQMVQNDIELFAPLKNLLAGGDVLSNTHINQVRKRFPHLRVINGYGPTENTTFSVTFTIEREYQGSIPIGRPIANSTAYIVDRIGHLQPIGVVGELWVGGDGVALGYMNNPLLTSDKFTINPFLAGDRVYHTGDLARWLPDGIIEFLGRKDQQVKIRGFRIEMEEIENCLNHYQHIKESVVIARDSKEGGKYLCAYIVLSDTDSFKEEELRTYIAGKLPHYMVPSYFIVLAQIPLTPNGKVDRRALPEVTGTPTKDYIAPTNEIEAKMVTIWSEILGVEKELLGVTDNFFHLGGHSLKVNTLIARIHKAFGVKLPMALVFKSPFIRALSQNVLDATSTKVSYPEIKPATEQPYYPLSFGQQRLWFVSQMEKGNEAFNMPSNFIISGELDIEAINKTFFALIQRHESFRTSICTLNGEPVQIIHPHVDFQVELKDVTMQPDLVNWLTKYASEEASRPFDLEKSPLLRVQLLKIAPNEHLCMVNMHHIISDGLSVEILRNEQKILYEAFRMGKANPLPPLKLQYKDYAVWERQLLTEQKLEELRLFWGKYLGGKIVRMNLPIDKPRLKRVSFNGDAFGFTLPASLVQQSHELAKKYNVTLYVLYLALFNLFLSKVCHQEQVAVVSGVGAREHPDLEGVVGIFVRGYILQAQVKGEQTFADFLLDVYQQHSEVMAHNIYPFERLRKEFFSDGDQRNYGFVHFNLFNRPSKEEEIESYSGNLDLAAISQYKISKDDLSLAISEDGETLHVEMEYNTDIFLPAKVKLLAAWFKNIIQQVFLDEKKELQHYSLCSGKEQELFQYLQISDADIESICFLTPTQRDLHLNCILNPEGKAYREVFYKIIRRDLAPTLWKEALYTIHQMYPILRSTLINAGEDVYLGIRRSIHIELEYRDLTQEKLSPEAVGDRIKEITEHVNNRLDDPMTQYYLLKIAPHFCVALLSIHHIIFDGVAGRTLFTKAEKLYGIESDELSKFEYISSDFYSHFHQLQLARFDTQRIEAYWRAKFADLQKLRRTLGPHVKNKFLHYELLTEKQHMEQVTRYCKENRVSVPLYFRTLYGFLIRLYCAVDGDFLIREITDGREEHHRDLIGCYYQATPLVFKPQCFSETETIANFFQYVRSQKKELGDNQYISIFLQNQLIGEEELRFYYNFHAFSRSEESEGESFIKVIHHPPADVPDDSARLVEFVTAERAEGFRLLLHYNEAFFDGERFLERLIDISKQIVAGAQKMGELCLVLADEAQSILHHASAFDCDYPHNQTLHEIFRQQVARTPNNPAISFAGQCLSYKELDRQSDCLAMFLKEHYQVKVGDYVALVLERSNKVVISMLAILKTGAAYVPVDPDYPQDRILFTLTDSAVVAALFDNRQVMEQCGLTSFSPALCLDEEWERIMAVDGVTLENQNNSFAAAYVIYTSGSTGRPKGVIVEHNQVVRLFFNDKFQFDFNASDIWTMFHSHCFDFSVWEMYGALLFGGKLIIIPKMVARETSRYLKCLKEERVTILNQTPTAFYKLSEEEMQAPAGDLCLRYIIFGGEALHPIHLKEWRQRYPGTKLINMFGITETTVHVTYLEVTDEDIQLNLNRIGKPIPTTSTYILDNSLRLLPMEMDGEICVGGDGVARGYLNRVELTAEKFLKNPYKSGDRLYRSGDLGRISIDGELNYLGRIDFQVQLRGFRVELGEIEKQLLKQENIKEAVVIDREATGSDQAGEIYLCAYLTADEDIDVTSLRAKLADSLPDYMIPSYFVQLESIPLTSNGKVNRRALPEPQLRNISDNLTPPRNKQEEILQDIWAGVLGLDVPRIGIDSDFFELGGHSLRATSIISRIHKALDIKIPLPVLFETPTIRGLSDYIESVGVAQKEKYLFIPPAESKEYYPLSSAQRRLFVIQQMDVESTSYHIPAFAIIEGAVKKEWMEETFRQLIIRHEGLRTSFEVIHDEPVQVIHAHVDFALQYYEANQREAEEIANGFIRSFDLTRPPLIRVGLIYTGDDKYILMIDMHHLMSDAVSHRILMSDFFKLYGAEKMPPLKLQYKDFSQWQSSQDQQLALKKQEEYWLKRFADKIPILNLPIDFPRPEVFNFAGDAVPIEISGPLYEKIHALVAESGMTMSIFFLSVFTILLSRYTGQDDLVVGIPISGRRHVDLENIIGFFANMLAMRNHPIENKPFYTFLDEVKNNFYEAYENQDAQFEELVWKLKIKRESGRHPLVEAVFTMQSLDIGESEIEKMGRQHLKVTPYSLKGKVTHFDLLLIASETGSQIDLYFEYGIALFKRSTIEGMAKHFIEILTQVVEHKGILLKDIHVTHGYMDAKGDTHRDDDDDWTFDDDEN